MIALALALAADLCPVGDDLALAHRGLAIGERTLGSPREIVAIAASADGLRLAEAGGLAGEYGRLRVWDVTSARELWTLDLHSDRIQDVVWSLDGERLFTAGADGRIGCVTATGELEGYLEGHSSQVLCLDLAPDGTLASGSLDRTVRLWREGREVGSLARHAGAVNALAFAPDGGQLASASSDGTVRIWQHAIGRQRKIVDLERGGILSVLWSEQGLFAGTSEGAVCELDWIRARVDAVHAQHSDWVQALALAGDAVLSVDASGELLHTPLETR